MGAGGAAPQVGDLAQVLRQVVLVLGLGSQFQVPAERIQPYWVGPAGGGGVGWKAGETDALPASPSPLPVSPDNCS